MRRKASETSDWSLKSSLYFRQLKLQLRSHFPAENPERLTPASGSGAKLRAHFRKWWWVYLIFLISCVLIIVLCVIYIAFPRKSQNDINHSTLTVKSLVLSNPSPSSFHLQQTSVIGTESHYQPNLDAFNVSLSLDGGNPFAYVEIPALHATNNATSVVDQEVKIADMDAFTAYTTAVLNSEQVKLDVRGQTALHEARFPTTTVNYLKTATMQGLNKLSGFAVTNLTIELTPEPDGTNMLGTVSIPNPSAMTISMGNVTLTNYLHATRTPLGTTTLTNLTLHPGNNTLPLRSAVNQTLLLHQLLTIQPQNTIINDNNNNNNNTTTTTLLLPVDIVGNSSVYDGSHLSYFEQALRGVNLTVTLDVGKALGAAVGAGEGEVLAGLAAAAGVVLGDLEGGGW